jgi:hypothetical protein
LNPINHGKGEKPIKFLWFLIPQFRFCNAQGSDLLQVSSSTDEDLVLGVLGSRQDFAQPVMPGYYHTGLYQRQSGKLYYHRNGVKV